MKKIILSVVAVAAIAVGYQKYTQAQTMSDLMLANVEALAHGEADSNGLLKGHKSVYVQVNQVYMYCCGRSEVQSDYCDPRPVSGTNCHVNE